MPKNSDLWLKKIRPSDMMVLRATAAFLPTIGRRDVDADRPVEIAPVAQRQNASGVARRKTAPPFLI